MAVALAFLVCWIGYPTAWAQQRSETISVDREQLILLRDKARGYDAVCQRLPPEARPDWLVVLCEDPGVASEWWVRAEKQMKTQKKLDECQRKCNADRGALAESRRQKRGWIITTSLLAAALGGTAAGWIASD